MNGVAAVALLLWLRFAMIWLGLFLGLVAGKPEAVMAVQILVWPLGFLSNAFSDPGSMPGWLGTIAEWNPLSATWPRPASSSATRAGGRRLLGGHPRARAGDPLAAAADRDLLPARGGEVPLALPLAPPGASIAA